MSVKFYGYASVFGWPNTDGNDKGKVYLPGCFNSWLKNCEIDKLPMCNGHDKEDCQIGRWLHVSVDGLGLFVIGELFDTDQLPLRGTGLSISLHPQDVYAKSWTSGTNVVAYQTPQGGLYISEIKNILEISLVRDPANSLTRILGLWPIYEEKDNVKENGSD